MKYLIDAYNLIGKCRHLCLGSKTKHIELLEFLKSHQKSGDFFYLVFDGHSNESHFGIRERLDTMDLYFTDKSESADDYIVNFIHRLENKQSYVVISSDKEVLSRVSFLGGVFKTCELFLLSFENETVLDCQKPSPNEDDTNYWLEEFGKDR